MPILSNKHTNSMSRSYFLLLLGFLSACAGTPQQDEPLLPSRPNLLFAIADDQSFPYTSAYGNAMVLTPAFDLVAQEGVLFTNAFSAAPQCSPSRAAILTGRNIWQLEEAGTHSSYFPKKFTVFTDQLEAAGYQLGYTGKPWGPGNWQDAGWSRNPVGPNFSEHKYTSVPASGINANNYSANFKAFMAQRTADQPFFFWFGSHEPHRVYEAGSGQTAGKTLPQAVVPAFLPNDSLVQSDILDHALEIEWFDRHLQEMITYLQETGEWENTIVVVTADNGMPFPYAKANLQEYGTHVPLAIGGPGLKHKNRRVSDLVSLIDLAPTFLDLAGIPYFAGITGKTLIPILSSTKSGLIDPARTMVLTGRERHTHARPDNLGYPARAIRTQEFLYIQNLFPERWPAGDPPVDVLPGSDKAGNFSDMMPGYHDIDNSPSKSHVLDEREILPEYFRLGFERRPAEELYDILTDPGCIKNLAADAAYEAALRELKQKLVTQLTAQGDPRLVGGGMVFESYPRFGAMRQFPGFRDKGVYNPAFQE